jgi:hypothetical protein
LSRIGIGFALFFAAMAVGCKSHKSGSGTEAAAKPPGEAAPSKAGASAAATCTGSGPNLVKEGSFEAPPVAPGNFDMYDVGKQIGAWTVVGAPGNVAPISGTFNRDGFALPAQDGAQSVDMTGMSNTATGVAQTIATESGKTYCLSFWIGNVSNPGGAYGASSAISVRLDGKEVAVETNDGGAGTKTVEWRHYTVPFTATSAETKLELINADPQTDTSNLLDSVAVN